MARRRPALGIDGKERIIVRYDHEETKARRAVWKATERVAMRGTKEDILELARAWADWKRVEREKGGG